jgi:mono/diheme cytochrome c family protein
MVLGGPSSAKESQALMGSDVYARAHCAACHGGLGYGGAGPRLRGEPLLEADTYVVGQILLGRGIMPSFGDKLSDREIAAVATYIRTSWGNDFGPVTPERVAEIRKSLEEQQATDSAPPR